MKIAVLPGDGIGPEIVAQAVKVLDVLRSEGLSLEMKHAPVGGAGYEAAGDPLPTRTLDLAREADAVLFGAVGGPRLSGARPAHSSLLARRRSPKSLAFSARNLAKTALTRVSSLCYSAARIRVMRKCRLVRA